MSFKHVGSGLAGIVTRWIDDPELHDRLVAQAWTRACGESIARHTSVESFTDGVLKVRVDEVRWMPTLREMHVDLVDRLRQELGSKSVRRLEWVEPEDDDPGAGRSRKAR